MHRRVVKAWGRTRVYFQPTCSTEPQRFVQQKVSDHNRHRWATTAATAQPPPLHDPNDRGPSSPSTSFCTGCTMHSRWSTRLPCPCLSTWCPKSSSQHTSLSAQHASWAPCCCGHASSTHWVSCGNKTCCGRQLMSVCVARGGVPNCQPDSQRCVPLMCLPALRRQAGPFHRCVWLHVPPHLFLLPQRSVAGSVQCGGSCVCWRAV